MPTPEPMRYLLDTSFLIDHWYGAAGERLAALHASANRLYVTEIVVCELLSGLRRDDFERGLRLLRPFEFVQPGPDVAALAGRWRSEAHAAGRRLSLADALIAAAAHSLEATVVTRNVRDFALMPVAVESY